MEQEEHMKLKGGQYVFIHHYPPHLLRSDLTSALLNLDIDVSIRFIEFTHTPGNAVVVVKSNIDKQKMLALGSVEVQSEENPLIKETIKFYWGGELPEPDPPLVLLQQEVPKWTLTKNGQIAKLVNLISTASKIAVLTGEGLAEEIGIPDFRPPKDTNWEIYNEFTKSNLLNPEKEQTRKNYWEHHAQLYEAFKEAKPSATHKFVSFLEDNGKLLRVITQNIDGLQELTIKDRNLLISLNGSEQAPITCLNPNCQATPIERSAFHPLNSLPVCPSCSTPLKTQVLALDEEIPAKTLREAVSTIAKADLVIVFGSGLMWFPFCNLLQITEQYTKTMVTVNKVKTVFDGAMALAVHGECKEICESVMEMIQTGKTRVEMGQSGVSSRMGTKRGPLQ